MELTGPQIFVKGDRPLVKMAGGTVGLTAHPKGLVNLQENQ